MITVIDTDPRICRIAQESLSALGPSVQTFQSLESFSESSVSGTTELIILGLTYPEPSHHEILLNTVLKWPDLWIYPLSLRPSGPCTLVEFYERQLTVSPEPQARLVSLLILLRQATMPSKSVSLSRFSSALRTTFWSCTDRAESSLDGKNLPGVRPQNLLSFSSL